MDEGLVNFLSKHA